MQHTNIPFIHSLVHTHTHTHTHTHVSRVFLYSRPSIHAWFYSFFRKCDWVCVALEEVRVHIRKRFVCVHVLHSEESACALSVYIWSRVLTFVQMYTLSLCIKQWILVLLALYFLASTAILLTYLFFLFLLVYSLCTLKFEFVCCTVLLHKAVLQLLDSLSTVANPSVWRKDMFK